MTSEEFEAKWESMTPKERDAWVVEVIYERPVIWVTGIYGIGEITPYTYDPEAVRNGHSTTTNLPGGCWEKAKTLDGKKIEFFGRYVSSYTKDISFAWEVEEKINEQELYQRYIDGLTHIVELENSQTWNIMQQCERWFFVVHATPEQRCKAALIAKVVD